MATLYDSYRTPDPSTAPGVGGSVTGTVTIVAITQRDAGDGNTLTRLGWKIPVDHGEFSKSGIPPGRYAVEWTLSHGAAMDASMGSGRSPRSITIEDTDTPQRLRVLLGMASIPDTTAADRLREIVADWLADNPIAVTPAAVGSAIAAAGPAQTAVDDRVDAGIESADLLTKTVADASYAPRSLSRDPEWIRRLALRRSRPLTIAVLTHSRGEGYNGGDTGHGVTAWSHTFPGRLSQRIRNHYGLPTGGPGWKPLKYYGSSFDFSTPTLSSGAAIPGDINADTGVPGSQWMIPPGSGGITVRVPLEAGCTSVDLITTAPTPGDEHWVHMVGQSGAEYEDGANNVEADGITLNSGAASGVTICRTRLANPGTYVDLSSAGNGFQALGIIEHHGDEISGVRVYNMAVSGISSSTYLTYASKTPWRNLMQWIAPDVAIVGLVGNDPNALIPPATTAANCAALLDATSARWPIVLTEPAMTTGDWDAYNEALRHLTAPYLVCDVAALGDASTLPGWFVADDDHYTEGGATGQGDVLAGFLL